jgi:glycosyltransferase involved in cell wall biosynthesis
VAVLLQGLEQLGAEVRELNVPLGLSTAERVAILHKPWLVYQLLLRLFRCWTLLSWRRIGLRPVPDAVLVGYLAQFDVILARLLFPRSVIALDLLVFADDTARDRGVGTGLRTQLLRGLDRLAIACASLVLVDTEEHLLLLAPHQRRKAVVAPVGSPAAWFSPPPERHGPGPLRVIFFGLYTPLQGAPVIGEALAAIPAGVPIEFTMVGTGQDFTKTRMLAGNDARTSWVDWVDSDKLPALVAGQDVCLGIFGGSGKSLRVVPTKVFEGAAAGCAIVTSDTRPQRRALRESAIYVPPGDAQALANVLIGLAHDPAEVARLRSGAFERATHSFAPARVAAPVMEALLARADKEER